jgi:hypothetical protein
LAMVALLDASLMRTCSLSASNMILRREVPPWLRYAVVL